jgi:4-carboxymuconolactone decarboxylase
MLSPSDRAASRRYGRAPWPSPDELDEAQLSYYRALTASPRRRDELMDAEGRLIGPFNARLLDPCVGTAIQAVGAALRFHCALSTRERELVILSVAHAEGSEYEWSAHVVEARKAGLTDPEIEAVRKGRSTTWQPSEVVCVELANELITTDDVNDESFARAEATIGATKIFDVVSIVGHYRHTALALRVWRVPGTRPE